MALPLTAAEWGAIFPSWPKTLGAATEIGEILHEMETAVFANVLSVVLLPMPWPGMVKREPDLQATVLAQVGRWYVTADGLLCLDENIVIPTDRFEDEDLVAHIAAKSWLYDPSDLVQALAHAYEQLLLATPPTARAAMLQRQLHYAIEHGKLFFAPTVLQRHHLYLINRMTADERTAFCAYLAQAGFVPKR